MMIMIECLVPTYNIRMLLLDTNLTRNIPLLTGFTMI